MVMFILHNVKQNKNLSIYNPGESAKLKNTKKSKKTKRSIRNIATTIYADKLIKRLNSLNLNQHCNSEDPVVML